MRRTWFWLIKDGQMAGNDMRAAEETYSGFIGLLKWTVPLTAVVTIVVVALIA